MEESQSRSRRPCQRAEVLVRWCRSWVSHRPHSWFPGRPGSAAASTVGLVAYGVALVDAPRWLHAASATASYDDRLLVISVGGSLVVIVGLLYTARNYQLSRREQLTDRFSQALERLGSDQPYVRVGAIRALE